MDAMSGEPDWELMASSEWSPTEEMLEKAKGFTTEAALEADDRSVVQEWKDIESKCEKAHEVRPWPWEGSFRFIVLLPYRGSHDSPQATLDKLMAMEDEADRELKKAMGTD